MPRIRLRYLLIIPALALLTMLATNLNSIDIPPLSSGSQVTPRPKLPAGYYLVLETRATAIPEDIDTHMIGKITYVGPMQTISEFWESEKEEQTSK